MAYQSGSPTVISQVSKAVLGDSLVGQVGFFVVQWATMLILWTGANTPFNGFPFLANFVAADGLLPRWLTKRGHRLAFSNGIVVLAVFALALILGTGAHVDKLVAFYAIGVFTGFTLAGFGMAKHFATLRGHHWRAKVALNNVVGAVSALVVVIFAVTKFTEGAWLVVLVFPIMVVVLLRLRRAYDRDAAVLAASPVARPRPVAARTSSLVLVDSIDLASLRALRYAQSLRPSELRVVHFAIDSSRADALGRAWDQQGGITLPLEVIDCPDRRLPRAALELVERIIVQDPRTQVTVLLPRRSYGALLGRLLHDRTADDIAAAVSQVRGVAATIVPFDASHPSRAPWRREAPTTAGTPVAEGTASRDRAARPAPPAEQSPKGHVAIAAATHRRRAVLQGRIRSVQVSPIASSPSLRCELVDDTGGVTLLFYGRRQIPGIVPGAQLCVEGRVGDYEGHLAICNPIYRLLAADGD